MITVDDISAEIGRRGWSCVNAAKAMDGFLAVTLLWPATPSAPPKLRGKQIFICAAVPENGEHTAQEVLDWMEADAQAERFDPIAGVFYGADAEGVPLRILGTENATQRPTVPYSGPSDDEAAQRK